jgi:hypothetical protein
MTDCYPGDTVVVGRGDLWNNMGSEPYRQARYSSQFQSFIFGRGKRFSLWAENFTHTHTDLTIDQILTLCSRAHYLNPRV